MRVLEIFQSINGEGLSSGHLTTFVRFAGCNMNCKWCDTAYSINPSKETVFEMTPKEIAAQCTTDYVTLTGGEPLIQDSIEMLYLWSLLGSKRIEIETNGSVDLTPYAGGAVNINMDFKLDGSKGYAVTAVKNMSLLVSGDCVKFVVQGAEDMYRVADILYAHKARYWVPLISTVWGDDLQQRQQEIVDFMKSHKDVFHDARLQLQMHKYIWDANKRCV